MLRSLSSLSSLSSPSFLSSPSSTSSLSFFSLPSSLFSSPLPSLSPMHSTSNYFDRRITRTFSSASPLLSLSSNSCFSSLPTHSSLSYSHPSFSFSYLPKQTPSPFSHSFLSNSLTPHSKEKEGEKERRGEREGGKEGSEQERANKEMAVRLVIFGLFVLTLSYFSVPLYRMFCASTGYGKPSLSLSLSIYLSLLLLTFSLIPGILAIFNIWKCRDSFTFI